MHLKQKNAVLIHIIPIHPFNLYERNYTNLVSSVYYYIQYSQSVMHHNALFTSTKTNTNKVTVKDELYECTFFYY